MSSFAVCLLILLAHFKNTNANCNDVDHTFSFTKVESCKYPFPCFIICTMECSSTVVDGCIEDNKSVRITIQSNVRVLRRGAFRNLPQLTGIVMNNTGLEDMEPNAFQNLPAGFGLGLSYNKLSAIRGNVFSKTLFNTVDLTSNQIGTIEDHAFANMPELTNLFLGGNLIEEINENWFANSPIQWLNLPKNKLKVIKIETLSKLTNLIALDVSYNQIHRIDVLPKLTKKMTWINLTGNDITDLRFLSGFTMNQLFVGLNRISYVDDETFNAFGRANVENMFVQPNPWHCICLRKFETFMRVRNITIGLPAKDISIKWDAEPPVCVEGEVKRNMCNGISQDEIESGRRDYFKAVSYDKFIKSRSEYGLFG